MVKLCWSEMQITVTIAGTGHTYTHVYNLDYASAIMCFNSFHIFSFDFIFCRWTSVFDFDSAFMCTVCIISCCHTNIFKYRIKSSLEFLLTMICSYLPDSYCIVAYFIKKKGGAFVFVSNTCNNCYFYSQCEFYCHMSSTSYSDELENFLLQIFIFFICSFIFGLKDVCARTFLLNIVATRYFSKAELLIGILACLPLTSYWQRLPTFLLLAYS